MTTPQLVIHGTPLSGHTHRVECFAALLGLDYRFVDAPAAVRQTAEFRALNPLGQIPVLEDGEVILADSNAILVYLAKRYDGGGSWLPEAPEAAARVQRWLSIAAGEIKFGPALARVSTVWGPPIDLGPARELAARLFHFMEQYLTDRPYLAADHPTIADLACYAYLARAPEGGISLEPYPAIRAWIARLEALPRWKAMPRSS